MDEKIEISIRAAQDLIPCMEDRLRWLEGQAETFIVQRDSLRTSLAELKARVAGENATLNDGKPLQRFPKGHGDKVIFDLLFSLPAGEGLKMSDIEARTGINHATVFRVLKTPKRNQGRFIREKGVWKLTPPK